MATDFLSVMSADNIRFARSKTLYEKADGTYNLINIPKFAFVTAVWLIITQAYAGGAGDTCTVGFTGNGETADPDGFIDDTFAAATSTGVKCSNGDAQPASSGKWFNTAGGQLTITLAKGTQTTLMIGHVVMAYTTLH